MTEPANNGDSGLRERKKLRTRTRLIDAALELAERQGYERTTVEQIAEAVEVSPRTFARYFPTKDAAILSLVDQQSAAVGTELALIGPDVRPLEALLAANLAALQRTKSTGGPLGLERFVAVLRIINNSPDLRSVAVGQRSVETRTLIAERLGTSTEDRTVKLISAVWAAILVNAWGNLGTEADTAEVNTGNLTDRMHQMLIDTFDEFAAISAELRDSV
ncbi:MAG: TetR/AcrR family transcriptional regulator [Mycobacterium sp.]|nr:TetR/AcrR family transcriptional regulator [Mycobacterium sp.]